MEFDSPNDYYILNNNTNKANQLYQTSLKYIQNIIKYILNDFDTRKGLREFINQC